MKTETKEACSKILKECVENTLKRMKTKGVAHKPFHEALLSKDLIIASQFERSFSTSLGQRGIEEISRRIALDSGAECIRQKKTSINIYQDADKGISDILKELREGTRVPNWKNEVQSIQAFHLGRTQTNKIISDLWIKKDDKETFFSIKTVFPNLDQAEKAKQDMLRLVADDPSRKVIFALFYNPYGDNRKDYKWSFANKIFNTAKDDCVLIGADYWNYIGGKGTYSELLEIFSEVGEETRKLLAEM